MVVGKDAALGELFEPRSVAVIGASNRPGTVGFSLFRNILAGGFRGVAYPVNPSWSSVSGVRCYRDVGALPETPDLAVIIVPARAVAGVADALGRRGTKGLVVISAGFREVGRRGAELESELVRIVRRHRMSIIGPNCFGVLNTDPEVGLNATFSDTLPPRGNIAFVSQSGALCAGILKYGISERLGFSRFLSVGNRAGVDENDLLGSLADDPATKVILLYIESLASGRRFLEAAREVTDRKPVLVIKSGRSPLGERAALSHTGSLARSGQDRLYDSLFEQSGVIRADTIGDLFRMAKIFSSGVALKAPRIAILTNSGGPGIVATDACARFGIQLPPLPESARSRLAPRLSPSASLGNPVDMTADAQPAQYRVGLQALLAERQYEGVLVIATPTGETPARAVTEAIVASQRRSRKAVIACLFGLNDLSEEVAFLERNGIPAFTFPEEAVAGLGNLARYRAWSTRPRTRTRKFRVDRALVRRVLHEARSAGVTVLPEYAARRLVAAYGVPVPRFAVAKSAAAAGEEADRIGYPVVLKAVSPDISHKTDVGGVALGLEDAAAVRRAAAQMSETIRRRAPQARLEGFEVEEMVRDGKEVLLGVHQDPDFGPVLAFGTGGIYVEVLNDVTFRLAPIRPLSAINMVRSIRSYRLLTGVRGESASDIPKLCETLERISQLAVEVPEVAELDINPLLVRPEGRGVVAVDARAVLRPSSRSVPRA
ncbi:MAG TPA: acetate--CoA ligase family protein [Thermoplasmata archaeon]|nr:acetate--CoA ligase family protein [Thermoplasmata archaeon]